MLKKLKLKQIIVSIIIAIMVLLPGIANADSANVNVSGSTGARFDFSWQSGAYTSSPGTFANINLHSASDFSGNVFCMNPYAAFYGGVKTVMPITSYYTNLTQYDVNYLAAGIDYILNRAGIGDYATKNAIAQVWIWTYVSGKTTFNITSYNYSGTGSGMFAGIKAAADNWAASNAATCTGAGWVYVGANDGLSVDHSKGQISARFTVLYGGYLTLVKETASNKDLVNLCLENYSLAGATYRVSASPNMDQNAGELVVNADGSSNTIYLPQAGKYYAKEIVAPKGYKLDPRVYEINVVSGQTATLRVSDEPLFDPLTLKVQKKAAEGADKNLSLEGAEYTVKYYKEYLTEEQAQSTTPFRTWVFRTDKNGIFGYNDRWKVGGDDLFKNESGIPVGLLGTYTVEETKAPKGFARTNGVVSLQHVKQNNTFEGITVLKDLIDEEKPQTVSIKIKKVDKETGESKAQGHGTLKGAAYKVMQFNPLTAQDEEVGRITTDEKGEGVLEGLKPGLYKVSEVIASSGYIIDKEVKEVKAGIKEPNTANFEYEIKSKEQVITVKINKTTIDKDGNKINLKGARLQLLNEDKAVIEEWISDGEAKVFKGLAKGKYYIHEAGTPDGYIPLEEDVDVTVLEKEDAQSFEVFNEPVPEIKTSATFGDNTKVNLPEKKVTVTDEVSYKKLIVGKEYTAKAKLVNADDENEVIATGETTFTAEKSNGKVRVNMTFDASKLEGTTMVVFEDLYKNGKLLVSHQDLTDKEQTVSIPSVKTKASDKVDGGKDMFAGKKETLVDKVSYEHLIPGKEYTVSGTLMDKDTGKPILDDGKEVTAEKNFTAEKANGIIELEFTFNASALNGKTIVAFEDLTYEKKKVATHADIDDVDQTVYIPNIKTTATETETLRKEVNPLKKVRITDKIEYKNLIEGKIYSVKGQLINKATNKVITEADGNFVAEAKDGIVSLDFTFDATNLKGIDTVVFEEIRLVDEETGDETKLVAEHKDIDDKDQTVKVTEPKVKTTATINDSKSAVKKESMTIKDKVNYSNLVAGKKYTVKGKLMDKSTGKAFTVNGKEITAEKTFTAEKANGTIELEFTFDGSTLKKSKIVVFEDIYDGDELIGTHSDIDDVEQTVEITEKPNTGDNSHIYLYLILLVLSTSIFVLTAKFSKNR